MEIPAEWQPILEYMEKYPSFAFRSSRLSVHLLKVGIRISSQKVSKILLEMHSTGMVEKFTVGRGNHMRSYYRVKK